MSIGSKNETIEVDTTFDTNRSDNLRSQRFKAKN